MRASRGTDPTRPAKPRRAESWHDKDAAREHIVNAVGAKSTIDRLESGISSEDGLARKVGHVSSVFPFIYRGWHELKVTFRQNLILCATRGWDTS